VPTKFHIIESPQDWVLLSTYEQVRSVIELLAVVQVNEFQTQASTGRGGRSEDGERVQGKAQILCLLDPGDAVPQTYRYP
jgi:hypothetical protein